MLSEYKAIAKTTQRSKVIRLFWYSINDYFSNEQIKKMKNVTYLCRFLETYSYLCSKIIIKQCPILSLKSY